MPKPTCLVTGATGLIGSHLIPLLLKTHQVIAVTAHDEKIPKVETIKLNLSTNWSEKNLPTNIDAVVHLAQSENFRLFPEKANDIFAVNTLSTVKLLDHARKAGAKHFVFASSAGVYQGHSKSFSEDFVVNANSEFNFYLSSKLSSELFVRTYKDFFTTAILRFVFVYGKNQIPHMLVPRLIESVKQGRPIQLQGKQGFAFNPTHASDAAKAIEKALTLKKSTTINVAGPEVLTLKQVVTIIGKKVGKKPTFEYIHTKPQNYVCNIERMKELLFSPTIQFADAVKELL